ncbi:YdcF family protein [Thioclava nitratireducens]|uniref:YdcF family protein n=1 Tax=Thioclava nitratireducens TaxID=1915078 RepID=UPI00248159EF|nr:YdcF family protein [Thioclava nitratireducens]WGT51472.1 YdcF family protein [Thioclava nitratireducens]
MAIADQRRSTDKSPMDTLVFIASKLAAFLLRAETWEALLLAGALIALVSGRLRAACGLLSLALAALLALGIFPLGDLLIAPLERTYPTNPELSHVDGIIILGGAEDGAGTARHHQVQLNAAAERVTAGLARAHRFPDARILLSGGSGALRDLARETMPGAEVMAAAFRETGFPQTRLLLETRSRNTSENARLSYDLAQPKPSETWVLVTSAFHMRRAMASFERAGWEAVVPYPVDFRAEGFLDGIGWDLAGHLDTLDLAIKEWVGIWAYAASGR